MTGTEDRYADIEVDVLDDAGVRAAIDNALARAGCTWEELQEQAQGWKLLQRDRSAGLVRSCRPLSPRQSDLERPSQEVRRRP